MSAEEMSLDPLFTFNPDLEAVSNLHTAARIIECNPDIYQTEAPWRIELPGGGVVRGTAANAGTWPTEFDAQPANRKIIRDAASGPGKVLEDTSEEIDAALEAYNDTVPVPPEGAGGSSGTSGTGGGGTGGSSGGTKSSGGSSGSDGGSTTGGTAGSGGSDSNGCACRTATGSSPSGLFAAAFALLAFGERRRRRNRLRG
jgi:MYXO-CTERM domain-containing protein